MTLWVFIRHALDQSEPLCHYKNLKAQTRAAKWESSWQVTGFSPPLEPWWLLQSKPANSINTIKCMYNIYKYREYTCHCRNKSKTAWCYVVGFCDAHWLNQRQREHQPSGSLRVVPVTNRCSQHHDQLRKRQVVWVLDLTLTPRSCSTLVGTCDVLRGPLDLDDLEPRDLRAFFPLHALQQPATSPAT